MDHIWKSFGLILYSSIFVNLRILLPFEKCPQPKNPRWAESGLGCGPLRTRCFLPSILFSFFCANPPQRIKTTLRHLSETALIAPSVISSQPSRQFIWKNGIFCIDEIRKLYFFLRKFVSSKIDFVNNYSI